MTSHEEFLSVLQPVSPASFLGFQMMISISIEPPSSKVPITAMSRHPVDLSLGLPGPYKSMSSVVIFFSKCSQCGAESYELPWPTSTPSWTWPVCTPSLSYLAAVVSQDLAVMPAEERRLVAEEGSYSLKTWLRKIEDLGRLGELQYWAPVSPSLLSCHLHSCLTSRLLTLDGHGWLITLDPLILWQPQSQPSFKHFLSPERQKTGRRRRTVIKEDLAAEDLGGRWAPAQGPASPSGEDCPRVSD